MAFQSRTLCETEPGMGISALARADESDVLSPADSSPPICKQGLELPYAAVPQEQTKTAQCYLALYIVIIRK